MISDLFGDLVNGHEVFFIQDAVSKSITKASKYEPNKNTNKLRKFRQIKCSKLFFIII